MTKTVDARRIEERVTLAALFVNFLKVSLLGFGGGLVWDAALSSNDSDGWTITSSPKF